MDRLWAFLSSEPGLVVLGFLLSSGLGGLLTYLFQKLSWRREARLDLYSQLYRDGTAFLERLSSIIDRRYFRLKRVLWAVEDGVAPEVLSAREKDYYTTVLEWNDNLRALHNQIRILIGEKEALAFLDYEDDYHQEKPTSLHYRFVLAHREVMATKNDPERIDGANRAVDELNWCMSSFLFDVTTLFTRRAHSLALSRLQPPKQVSEKARYISGPPGRFTRPDRSPAESAS